jgi:diguanylate cyclase (GGDEF)-like protein
VPTVATSHFVIDLHTLFVVTVFISATAGLLLIFAWMQNRRTTALALWGVGYLLGAAAAALLAAPALLPNAMGLWAGNTLLCTAYAIMWAGARSFEGRRVPLLLVAAGPIIWIAAFQFDSFARSAPACIELVSAILAAYALLAAREIWHAKDRELISRWPTLAMVLLHAGFLLSRIPFADVLAASAATGHPQSAFVPVIAFQALFVTLCLPFLRVAMSKERAELEQRKAALTDPLTGIANRRAFFDRGAPLLAWAQADRRSAALLLFDLDRFKEVNDTAGHQGGDRVLKAFCDLVGGAIGPRDLFGRLGGEEFGCLLADASMAQALQFAERLRGAFAALRMPGIDAQPTVSVGVAMAGEAGRTLPALLATADRALYRAKAEGRNRVARAPLVVIDAAIEGETSRRLRDRAAALPVPAAG